MSRPLFQHPLTQALTARSAGRRPSGSEPAPLRRPRPHPTEVVREPGLELVDCPECTAPASVTDAGTLASTDGPEHLVRVQCVRDHGFLMPRWMLEDA